MLSLLHDLPVIHDQDLVRVFNGLEPVGNHDHGLVLCQGFDRLHELIFIFRVNIGRCLIQEDHRRILHHGPGNGDALPFAAGKTGTFSPAECCRQFRRTTGETIFSYIRKCRLEYGMHLLLNSEQPVSDIAYAAGFSSTSYFIQNFRELTGTTPHQYRRIHKPA